MAVTDKIFKTLYSVYFLIMPLQMIQAKAWHVGHIFPSALRPSSKVQRHSPGRPVDPELRRRTCPARPRRADRRS